MTWKDFILFATFLLAVGNFFYSLYNNKRTTFINSVTAERVKWINTLRGNLSEFTGLVFHYAAVAAASNPTGPEWNELFRQTDRLRMLLKLQLNPKGILDRQIENLLDFIYTPEAVPNPLAMQETVHEIIRLGQQLLKEEWDKVKEESKYGDLRDNWWRKFWQDQCDCGC